MTLIAKEIKAVYKWTVKVRPTQASQHYVFDLTTSATDWTLGSRLSFVSWTWIVRNTSWSGWEQYAFYNNSLNIDRQNVKRLTYKSNTWWNTGSWNGSITQWIISGQEASTRPTSVSWTLWMTSQFTTSGGRTGGVGYLNTSLVTRNPNSTQNAEIILDLQKILRIKLLNKIIKLFLIQARTKKEIQSIINMSIMM